MTFYVMQQQVELSRPFERHAGAYTDFGHIIASIKNAGENEYRPARAPVTLPRRNEATALRIESKGGPIIVASNDKQKNIQPQNTTKADAVLESIWRDHVSTDQAATAKAQVTNPGIAMATQAAPHVPTAEDKTKGLMSPQVQQAIAQAAPAGKPAQSGERSYGFSSDQENAARLDVMVLSASVGEGASEIDSVEFTTLADENNMIQGDKGRLTFEYLLGQSQQTLSGVFTAKGHVPTRVDLPLEVGSFGSLIPLMTIDGMDNFLRKQNINAPGGFILVDLDQHIIDVEIDRPYQFKTFLNPDMKVTDADESARFVLFSGVASGNVMLRYLSNGRDIVERVAVVTADQILYDLPVLSAPRTHSFGLFEMESLSLTPRELTISGRNIRPFNRKNTAIQDSLNYYSLEFAASVVGTRAYTEIDHLGTTFYVGHQGHDKIVVPGQGFLNEVLEFHQLDRLENACMVQVNLPKNHELFEITVNGIGGRGALVLDESYLNRDGSVSLEATEFSTHAFVLGDIHGQIYMRVDYVDGAVDFISSYCVPGTYLVEQL